MTLSDLYRKVKGICECISSADVPLKCNGNDFNVDFQVESKDAIVSHIEVKQYLALTWIDIRNILSIAREVEDENDDCPLLKSELCDEILKRFNEQRKK